MRAVKKKDNKVLAGRIIGAFFILILVGIIYFLVTLFRPISINAKHLEGLWKKSGSTTHYYKFSTDASDPTKMSGTCLMYEKETGDREARNKKTYNYRIEKKDIVNAGKKQRVYVMTMVNVDDLSDTQEWKISQVSRATLDVTMNKEKTVQLTKANIF